MKTYTEKELKSILAYAYDNCKAREERNKNGFIAYNPEHKEERERDAMIVNAGLMDFYYEMQRLLHI